MIGSKISRRYAIALFSLGQEDGNFEKYGADLAEFSKFCHDNEEFGQVIADPIFAVEERKAVLLAVLEKSGFSDVVKNFLKLLVDKNRMAAIGAITEYYSRLTDEVSNIARAEITTAMPLKSNTLRRVEKSLERLTSKKIKSEVKEDQDLIGGIVVKIGDLILDGSVKAQLKGLTESF